MNEDFLKITHEELLRNPDLLDQVQRDARRYRAREVRRVLHSAWRAFAAGPDPGKRALRTASCG